MSDLDIYLDWAVWQRSAGKSERTIAERRGVVERMCDWAGATPAGFVTRDAVRYTGRAGLGASTRATYQASLRAFTAWAVVAGIREDDPMLAAPRVRRPRAMPRPIESSGLTRMLAVVNRRRTRMMILLAAFAGLRVHEIAKIHGHDIDLDAGVITVTGKGGKTALIPLHPVIAEAADAFPRAGLWFPGYTNNSRPVTARAVSAAIQRVMDKSATYGTPHQLRHWYGTNLLEAGADVRTVQELMRHESIQSTQIYTLVSQSRRREALGRLLLPAA